MQSCEQCKFLFYTDDLKLSKKLLDPDIDVCAFCQAGPENQDKIWKTIEEYPKYKISLSGKVKNSDGLIITTLVRESYVRIYLSKNAVTKPRFLHRIMLVTFRPNPENKPTVDHIDKDPGNNTLINLRWATHQENSQNRENKGSVSVLQCDDDGNIVAKFPSIKAAAVHFDVWHTSISQALNLKCRTKGFYWKYEDEEQAQARRRPHQEKLDMEHRTIMNEGRAFDAYQITPSGQIYSLKTKRYLKIQRSREYQTVALVKDGEKYHFYVHRLVAYTYLEQPKNSDQIYVNHKNGIKSDCGVENLEWCTLAENSRHAVKEGLNVGKGTSVCQFDMEGNFIECFLSFTKAAAKLGKNKASLATNAGKVCKGTKDSFHGFIWAYTEDCTLDEETQRYTLNRPIPA